VQRFVLLQWRSSCGTVYFVEYTAKQMGKLGNYKFLNVKYLLWFDVWCFIWIRLNMLDKNMIWFVRKWKTRESCFLRVSTNNKIRIIIHVCLFLGAAGIFTSNMAKKKHLNALFQGLTFLEGLQLSRHPKYFTQLIHLRVSFWWLFHQMDFLPLNWWKFVILNEKLDFVADFSKNIYRTEGLPGSW
jgi:hypothetical protein